MSLASPSSSPPTPAVGKKQQTNKMAGRPKCFLHLVSADLLPVRSPPSACSPSSNGFAVVLSTVRTPFTTHCPITTLMHKTSFHLFVFTSLCCNLVMRSPLPPSASQKTSSNRPLTRRRHPPLPPLINPAPSLFSNQEASQPDDASAAVHPPGGGLNWGN